MTDVSFHLAGVTRLPSTMPVRSFNIEDLLNYKKEDLRVSSESVQSENKQRESEVTIIEVENYSKPDNKLLRQRDVGVDRRNRKIHNSEGKLIE